MELAQFFPSTWELLLPNWNIFTVLGVFALVVGILGFVALFRVSEALNRVGFPFDISKISLSLILIGIVLIWGVSIFQDFVTSTGGAIIFWAVIVVGVSAVLIFYEPKKKM